MSMIILLTSLMLCCLLWQPVQGEDCPYKECYCSANSVYCSDHGFTTVPSIISSKYSQYSSLLFDGNQITHIGSGRLLPNQTEISFLNNPVTTIDDTAFDGSATTLQIFRVSYARFTKIPDAFTHLKALDDLSIASVKIVDWNVNAMKNLGKTVEKLYLNDVGLTTWPTWIQFFTRVTELGITSGSISSLPDGALDKLANTLTTLSLYNNSLIAVPKALSELTALQQLYIEQNKIIDLTWLPKSSLLTDMSLNNNRLYDAYHVSDALRPYTDTLTFVALQSNQLTAIPKLDFLSRIVSFDLSNNLISDISSGSMPSGVYDLDLENNRLLSIPRIMSTLKSVSFIRLNFNLIQVITGTDFPPTTYTVQLNHNLIREITDTSFPENSTIRVISLEYNPLIKLSDTALQKLQTLEELYLSNTRITRLPLGLASLTSLNIIDFTSVNGLVCTCSEKGLESRILQLSSENVKGTCGLTGIYEFFATFSPLCPPPTLS